ncbi:MAG: MFS transporter [Chloroflexi bacterium]|nr:MFS transporter [Chloroflexota bacterium]
MTHHRNNWRVTAALFALTGIVESFAYGHLAAFTPLYLEQLNVAPELIPRWTGVLAALGFVLGIPLLPLWGVWADRYSRKLIIVRSAYAGALMFALSALSANVWQLAASRLLVGLVLGNTGVMLAVQAEITPRERLGLAIALVTSGLPLGSALGSFFGGYVVQRWGVPTLLLIDAMLTMGVALLVTFVLKEEPRERRVSGSTIELLRDAGRNMVTTPGVLPLSLLAFVVLLGLSLTNPFVPIRISQLYGGSDQQLPLIIGQIISTGSIVMAIGTLGWGRISDRIGYLPVIRIGALSVALLLGAQALAWSLPIYAAGFLAQGLMQSGIDASIMALIALRTPTERRASVLSFSRLPQQFSWFFGPILGALLSPLGVPVIFAAGSLCGLLGFGATLLLGRERLESTGHAQSNASQP